MLKNKHLEEDDLIENGRLREGGVWFSLIIHPKFDVSNSTLVPIAGAVALSKSIKSILNIETSVKWPNDITLDGKKVAGMLVDASFQANNIEYLILGVGINFDIDVKKLEKRLMKSSNFYGVSSLRAENDVTPSEITSQCVFYWNLKKLYYN